MTVSTETVDVVVEGDVAPVPTGELQRVADALLAKHDWRFGIRDGGVHESTLPGEPVYEFSRSPRPGRSATARTADRHPLGFE